MLLLKLQDWKFLWMRNEKDFTYDAATATLTWKGTPTGTVYTHDVNLNITYTHNWGVVTKTFKVTVTRKVQ